MAVQWAATKLMTAQPKSTAPSMAKMGAAPNADRRDARSLRMAQAPASLTQPAVCQRARSRPTLWRYQDMGCPFVRAGSLRLLQLLAKRRQVEPLTYPWVAAKLQTAPPGACHGEPARE